MTEEQKIQELLKPRIKVIAPWPGMECKIADIIILPSNDWKYNKYEYCDEKYFSGWPNLFKLLEWWEERKPEDFPAHIKIRNHPFDDDEECTIIKIGVEADHKFYDGEYFGLSWKTGGGTIAHEILPATEAEYLSYINKQP